MDDNAWENELPLVSMRAAAELLGVSYPTLRKAVRMGQIRTVQVADRNLVPQSELKRLVESAPKPE